MAKGIFGLTMQLVMSGGIPTTEHLIALSGLIFKMLPKATIVEIFRVLPMETINLIVEQLSHTHVEEDAEESLLNREKVGLYQPLGILSTPQSLEKVHLENRQLSEKIAQLKAQSAQESLVIESQLPSEKKKFLSMFGTSKKGNKLERVELSGNGDIQLDDQTNSQLTFRQMRHFITGRMPAKDFGKLLFGLLLERGIVVEMVKELPEETQETIKEIPKLLAENANAPGTEEGNAALDPVLQQALSKNTSLKSELEQLEVLQKLESSLRAELESLESENNPVDAPNQPDAGDEPKQIDPKHRIFSFPFGKKGEKQIKAVHEATEAGDGACSRNDTPPGSLKSKPGLGLVALFSRGNKVLGEDLLDNVKAAGEDWVDRALTL